MQAVEHVGDYRVVRFLGAGGMGAVYEVEHVERGSRHAMKVLSEQHRHAPTVRDRFKREAAIMSKLGSHPHILGAEELVEDGDVLAVVMELVAGGDLGQALTARPGGLPWEEVWAILAPVIDAVAFAHEAKVVHRDLKPENILLRTGDSWPGVPVVADFGIAKVVGGAGATKAHAQMGTAGYGAPEQFRNAKEVGPEADVWALGMLAWRLLTGDLPIDPDDNIAVIKLQEGLTVVPRLTDVPEHVAHAIESCLNVEATRRPKDAAVLLKLLSPEAASRPLERPESGLAASAAEEAAGGDTVANDASAAADRRPGWWRTRAGKLAVGVTGALLVAGLLTRPRGGAELWVDFMHLVVNHGEDCDELTRALEPFVDRHEVALRAFAVKLTVSDFDALMALIKADDDVSEVMKRFGEVTDDCASDPGFMDVYVRTFRDPED